MQQTTVEGVMPRLREATAELHTRAEKSEFQQRLVRGGVTREEYGAWLGQMLLVHTALEGALRDLAAANPTIGSMLRPELFQEKRLRADLALLGVAADSVRPTPSVVHILGAISAAAVKSPVSLLGFNYVLEGSKNGSRFIARGVRRALGLQPGQGDTYLDPHGDEQPALWARYKGEMTATPFEESQIVAMIDAACRMFQSIEGIGNDLLAGKN